MSMLPTRLDFYFNDNFVDTDGIMSALKVDLQMKIYHAAYQISQIKLRPTDNQPIQKVF